MPAAFPLFGLLSSTTSVQEHHHGFGAEMGATGASQGSKRGGDEV
jgi:hypothetical protein